jgi:serine/threonine-protein kinase HipA
VLVLCQTRLSCELALTLNAKKKKISRKDFITVFNSFKLDNKQQENIFKKMEKSREKWFRCIDDSFISDEFKVAYKELINDRFGRISLIEIE